jgi:hypothetical protein
VTRFLDRLRADWRRGRALKQLRLGERQYWEWDSETAAGTLCFRLRFRARGETLVLFFAEIWAKDVQERGPYRADLGLLGGRRFLGIVCDLAGDAGFTRLRVSGQRTNARRERLQRVEFDVARFRQERRHGR